MTPRWLRTARDYPRADNRLGGALVESPGRRLPLRAFPGRRCVSAGEGGTDLAWTTRTAAHRAIYQATARRGGYDSRWSV